MTIQPDVLGRVAFGLNLVAFLCLLGIVILRSKRRSPWMSYLVVVASAGIVGTLHFIVALSIRTQMVLSLVAIALSLTGLCGMLVCLSRVRK